MGAYQHESNRDVKMICECREVDNRGNYHQRPDWHRDYCSNNKSRRQCGCQPNNCHCDRKRRRRYEVYVRELD